MAKTSIDRNSHASLQEDLNFLEELLIDVESVLDKADAPKLQYIHERLNHWKLELVKLVNEASKVNSKKRSPRKMEDSHIYKMSDMASAIGGARFNR